MSKKISQLSTAAKPLSGEELVVMNQNGSTVTSSVSSISDFNTTTIGEPDKIVKIGTYNGSAALVLSDTVNLALLRGGQVIFTREFDDPDPVGKIFLSRSGSLSSGQEVTITLPPSEGVVALTTQEDGTISIDDVSQLTTIISTLSSSSGDASVSTTVRSNSATWDSTALYVTATTPLILAAAPESYWPVDMTYTGSGSYDTTMYASSDPNLWSTNGGTVDPVIGAPWAKIFHDSTGWVYEYYNDTATLEYTDNTAPCVVTVSPGYAAWAAGSVSETANAFTFGLLGQIAVRQNNDVTVDTMIPYMCVREERVRWTQIA